MNSNYTGGSAPTLAFDINLKDTEVSEFPNSFIVEISNSDSKILPFGYSAILNFGRSDIDTNTDTDTDTNTDTNTGTSTNTDTNTSTGTNTGTEPKATIKINSLLADFPVTESTIELEFSKDVPWVQNDMTKITIDNNAEITGCVYNNKILTLSLKNRLSYDSTYKINISNLDYAENNSFTITTEGKATVSLKSASENFPVSGTSIELEFSKEIPWNIDNISKITIDNDVTITGGQYLNKVLALSFSGRLNYSKNYKVTVADLEGVIDNNQLSFTTQSLSVTPAVSSTNQNIAPNTDGELTILQPKFFIDYGKVIANAELAINSIKFNDGALPQSCNVSFDAATQTLTIEFTEDLAKYTEYQLSVVSFNDDDGAIINQTTSPMKFMTIFPDEILGNGTQEAPFLIFTEAQLKQLNETTPVNYQSGDFYFKQMLNITLTSNWLPIGNDSNAFIGKYDGNNKFISNLKFNIEENKVGLFGAITNSTIANLTLKDVNVKGGYQYTGALVGYSDNSLIENINISDNFTVTNLEEDCGGLVGYSKDSTIRNISGTGNISMIGWFNCGIIAGTSKDSDISNVLLNGILKVTAHDFYGAGGLVGRVSNTSEHIFENCSVVSDDTGYVEGDHEVGGLIGVSSNKLSVSKCYAKIPINGNRNAGGLIGLTTGCNLSNSYSDSSLTASNNISSIGGLIGSGTCNIANSYAAGSIRLNYTKASFVGVIVGNLSNTSSVSNTFSAMGISVTDGYAPTAPEHYQPSDINIPLWYQNSAYSNNNSGTSYVSNGYMEVLNWDSDVWDNLIEGSRPRLK